MANKLSSSKITVIISSLVIGLFLHMFLDGNVLKEIGPGTAYKLLQAVLLVIAVVFGVAWMTHYFVLAPKKQKTD